MTLIIDNYDSFTYNLVQLVGRHVRELTVVRNDAITVDEVKQMHPERVLISPGPGRPEHAGVCVAVIREIGPSTPLLGVCLGHQAIGYAFGGSVVYAPELMHGKTSRIHHFGGPLFDKISSPFEATRYHSLVVSSDNLPAELQITAATSDGTIMGLCHREYPITGIQFHPESVLTPDGEQLIINWLRAAASRQ
jgi:anthranilate synthase/aminodeoxychorismate synthase-like glutamine amidotransferase